MTFTYPATVLLALLLPSGADAQAAPEEGPAAKIDQSADEGQAQKNAEQPAESADKVSDRPFRRGPGGLGRPGRPGGFRRGRRGGLQGGRPPAGPGQGMQQMFRLLDKNGDGKLTKDEVPSAAWSRLGPADADGDGAITKKEAQVAARERGGRGPQRGMGPRGRMFRGGPGVDRGPARRGARLWQRGPAGPRGPRFGMRRGGPPMGGPRFGPGGPGRGDGRMQRRIEQLERQVKELKKAVEALSKPAE